MTTWDTNQPTRSNGSTAGPDPALVSRLHRSVAEELSGVRARRIRDGKPALSAQDERLLSRSKPFRSRH
jgi:hypothetical protein